MRRALLLLLTLLLAGCAVGAPAPAPAAALAASVGPQLQVVVVGDSITEADSPDFDAGLIGRGSWAWWATGRGVDVVGGWAHSGATTEDMLEGVTPMDADVLVLMAGNNDLDLDVPTPQVLDQLVEIARTVDVPRVVLSAVAPEDGLGDEIAELNARLAQLAAEQGWQFVDPMTDTRDVDGDYLEGTTLDGVHPTEEAAAHIGVALHEALLHPPAAEATVGPPSHTG